MKRYAYDGLQLFSFSSQSWDTRFSVGSRMLMRRCNTRKLRNFLNMQSELARDTFENWQSEFLQLMWQVMGLAYFLYVGSPSSKENDDRLEAKIDELLKINAGERGAEIVAELDERYLRVHGHARPHAHRT